MSSSLSPTEQETILSTLMKRPENLQCADCSSKSPCCNSFLVIILGVSLDFGVFVCMNCSGAHRALGPSITRVRSTKLDTWNRDWLENMKLGNSIINEYWEADQQAMTYLIDELIKHRKPTPCSTLCEIKKYVQDKYIKKKFINKDDEYDPLTKLKKGIEIVIAGSSKNTNTKSSSSENNKNIIIESSTSPSKIQNKEEILKILNLKQPQPITTLSPTKKNIELLEFDKKETQKKSTNKNTFDFDFLSLTYKTSKSITNANANTKKSETTINTTTLQNSPFNEFVSHSNKQFNKNQFKTFSGINSMNHQQHQPQNKISLSSSKIPVNFDNFFENAQKSPSKEEHLQKFKQQQLKQNEQKINLLKEVVTTESSPLSYLEPNKTNTNNNNVNKIDLTKQYNTTTFNTISTTKSMNKEQNNNKSCNLKIDDLFPKILTISEKSINKSPEKEQFNLSTTTTTTTTINFNKKSSNSWLDDWK